MIFGNPQRINYAYLLRDLLIKPDVCPGRDKLPKSKKEWQTFIDMSYRNRLVTLLYHFIDCKTCKSSVPRVIKGMIQQYYTETLIRYENYKKIRRKLKVFIRKTGIPLILIKDLDDKQLKKYYPPYYVPLKFDIDIFGKYKDFEKFREFLTKIGYDPNGYHYGWPDKPIPQYKFSLKDKNTLFPQIEFRYKAFTINPTKKNILDRENIDKFTQELWQNAHLHHGNIVILTPEYLFIYHVLIAFFEDNCKGLNNLYRVWLLLNHNKNIIHWEKIEEMSLKYKVTNVIKFVRILMEKEFSMSKNEREFRISQRLINLDYICSVKLPSDKYFSNWKYNYIHFLTRGILSEDSSLSKIKFFLHPRRLLYLVWELLA